MHCTVFKIFLYSIFIKSTVSHDGFSSYNFFSSGQFRVCGVVRGVRVVVDRGVSAQLLGLLGIPHIGLSSASPVVATVPAQQRQNSETSIIPDPPCPSFSTSLWGVLVDSKNLLSVTINSITRSVSDLIIVHDFV